MQTFVPDTVIPRCAQVLDTQRLNKQITETLQIHRALTDPDYGWQNHPAVKMWTGNTCGLTEYGHCMFYEWHNIRGHNRHRSWLMLADEHADRIHDGGDCPTAHMLPDWWGGPIHATHRARLLFKKPDHYSKHWPDDPIPTAKPAYVWPTKQKVA